MSDAMTLLRRACRISKCHRCCSTRALGWFLKWRFGQIYVVRERKNTAHERASQRNGDRHWRPWENAPSRVFCKCLTLECTEALLFTYLALDCWREIPPVIIGIQGREHFVIGPQCPRSWHCGWCSPGGWYVHQFASNSTDSTPSLYQLKYEGRGRRREGQQTVGEDGYNV